MPGLSLSEPIVLQIAADVELLKFFSELFAIGCIDQRQ